MTIQRLRWIAALLLLIIPNLAFADSPTTMQAELAGEGIPLLARLAREKGDARRGAALFFQPSLNCARCHDGEAGSQLGPDLATLGKQGTAEHLIESVLTPSSQIDEKYQSVVLHLVDGRILAGRIIEEKDNSVTFLDPNAGGTRTVLKPEEIESRQMAKQSLMPDGLVNLLSDRQQFLDLAKYLIEISEQGPARARELRAFQTTFSLPDYERNIDHATMIRSWNGESLRRGEAIYTRVCANCHGTKDQPGSMPTSLRFATGKFKNGSDPYSLYRTLTHGYGMMTPQTWMVPIQKYDVIHYLRETYLKNATNDSYKIPDDAYLARLPAGKEIGPAPSDLQPWVMMDYGSSLMNTYEISTDKSNIAYKGNAIRLDSGPGGVSRGSHWALFDEDTMRFAAAWSGTGFIDWRGIHFNGEHQAHPKLAGTVAVANVPGPGWANPETGRFDDPRLVGRDGRKYGPLPREWARYRGVYHFGDQTIFSYTIGKTEILELYGLESPEKPGAPAVYSRTLEIGPSATKLVARLAPADVSVSLVGSNRAEIIGEGGSSLLKIEPSAESRVLKVLISRCDSTTFQKIASGFAAPQPLKPLTRGGPRRWLEVLKTDVLAGKNDGPFAVDTLLLPEKNPWNALLRLTGFDFFPDGKSAAVCSWDGDVWLVSGLENPAQGLAWRRIASGLFQPLGLKLRDGQIFVTCRDQLVRLQDLNGDGETDFYECFNSDHQVTEHFHEFAMGLQTDDEGNFYYAKSGRHGLPAVVPHHGTLLKVSRDGSNTEILATGFRAANGVCLNPDGTFFVTDQEGFWTPKNRINLVEKGGFYGNMWGYTDNKDTSDSAMKQPLCWITNEFDRSPAELLWVTSEKWGPLKGSLLNLSYGNGKIYVVPFETVDGQAQGGMCALPIPTSPTGIMRGRFHPKDGQLYACGMFAWAGNQTQPGGFYRVRYTGKTTDLPIGLKAKDAGVEIRFTDPVDASSASQVENYRVKAWDLVRSKNYGSEHKNERTLSVTKATLGTDGKTVRIDIPEIRPTRGMEIQYTLKGPDGHVIVGRIHNTIHAVAGTKKPKPVKVFVLAGQSNMEGQAVVDLDGKDYNDGKGTLKRLFQDPQKAPLLKHLRTENGKIAVRDDVWVRYQREGQPLLAGPLSTGFSVYGDDHHFGPELQFGHVMGDFYDEQVLIIKTAWGGKSLYVDFRPPSSGGEVGPYYRSMIEEIRGALANLKVDFPAYQDQGYELKGFVWYQGWNDGVDPKVAIPQYEQNLANLIKDVRKDLSAPALPVVIGELTGPWVKAPEEWEDLRKAQAAVASHAEFKGNVRFVETHDFVRAPEDSPNPGHGHHEFGNAETYFLVGDALAKGMIRLLQPAPDRADEPLKPVSRTEKLIEGWKVRVDDRLLQPPNEAVGGEALRFLGAKLSDIRLVLPPDKVARLQQVAIVLDLTHGKLSSMQYHPSADWLEENGYSRDLEKCFHIPVVTDLVTKRSVNEQPWVILHELAHAYHDQELGFDDPEVLDHYDKFKKNGHGEKALLYNGEKVRHYALTTPMEFFAEMTESYFGVNDFFPFNSAELKEAEPEIFALMERIWRTTKPRAKLQ